MATEREKEFLGQVLANLTACGIAKGDVSITYENYLQDYEVVIREQASPLSNEDLAQVARLSSGGLIIRFQDAATDERFRTVQASQVEARSRLNAEAWLRDRNLLAGLPLFDPATQDLATYAKRIEAYCGVDPGTVLEVHDSHLLILRHTLDLSALSADATLSVINAVTASNLRDSGVGFGVIGTA